MLDETINKYRNRAIETRHVIEELIALLKENGHKLNTVNTLGPELEDVFVRLTGGDLNHED